MSCCLIALIGELTSGVEDGEGNELSVGDGEGNELSVNEEEGEGDGTTVDDSVGDKLAVGNGLILGVSETSPKSFFQLRMTKVVEAPPIKTTRITKKPKINNIF